MSDLSSGAALAGAVSRQRGERSRGAAPARPREKLASRRPLTALVVDDMEVNRRLALLLLRHLGYAADSAANGHAALDMAAQRPYDLILMDVQMPDLDGLEATRRLRERRGRHRPRIVAMTANAMAGDRERCLAAGMDDYLAKPLRLRELIGVLERSALGVLERSAVAQTPAASGEEDGVTVDWSRLEGLKPYDEDGSLVKEVTQAFLRNAPAQAAAVAAAQAAGDAPGVAAAAHALKGVAANVGAFALQSLCNIIESRSLAGDRQAVGRAIDRLEACVEAACAALAAGPPV